MTKAYFVPFFILSFLLAPCISQAQQANSGTKLNQIVAVVNDHIILKSDIDQQVQQYMLQMQRQQNQQIEFGEDIWYTVLENTIDRYVMLDQAMRDSVTVSNSQVDQQINQQINQSIEQVGSEEALEKQLGQSLVQIRADLREDYREQMIVQQFQQQKRSEIQITRPEVKEYYQSIPEDSLPTIPEQVSTSQIVATPPPTENAEAEARQLAEQLRDSLLNHGKTIEELAKKYSDGPAASEGGKLPLMALNDLVAEYSAAASALEPGEISQVVKTTFGFHVIRLNRRVGDQIDTNHILITVDEQNFDDQQAIEKLEQIRDSVLNHNADFAEMARKHSEDPNTAPQGGRILNPNTGARLIPLEDLDPALYRIVLLLDEEAVSEPKQFTLNSTGTSNRAFRIVRLDRQVPEHTANLEQDYEQIKNAALQQKQRRDISEWIDKLRADTYIEYKIPVPTKYKNT